jgi:hypothetical protein
MSSARQWREVHTVNSRQLQRRVGWNSGCDSQEQDSCGSFHSVSGEDLWNCYICGGLGWLRGVDFRFGVFHS